MSKVIDIKTKEQTFPDWLKDVTETNFKHSSPRAVLLVWEDDEGTANQCRWNCDVKTFLWFSECMKDKALLLKFDKFMKENINEYIEYIE